MTRTPLGSLVIALIAALSVPCCTIKNESSTELTNFVFRDQLGQSVGRGDLRGHVWIADFVYTTCKSACPLLTSRLVTLQRRLTDPSLRFVSFSVDPENDTPETLRSYAARWNPAETRWHLLATDPAGLSALNASMQLELSRDRSEFVHTNRFFLIDGAGKVSGSYDSSDDGALDRLLADTARLLGAAPVNTVAGEGPALFTSLGCAGCHDDSDLAPPLAGLIGSPVMFEFGNAITADDAYVRESIASPSTRIVAGYPNSMPTYGSLLSEAQLGSLVSYITSLRSAPEHATSKILGHAETDPVCGMATRVNEQTPTANYQGHDYHFCSLSCAKRFRKDPSKYVKGEGRAPQ